MTPLEFRARLALEAGITITDLAHHAGIRPRRMSRWVNDEAELTEDEWDRCLVVLATAIENYRRLTTVRESFTELDGGTTGA
jgi:plasmid maintenance system antidote protein VapI